MEYLKYRKSALETCKKNKNITNYNLTTNTMENLQTVNAIEGTADEINENFILFVLKRMGLEVEDSIICGDEMIVNVNNNEIKFVKTQEHKPSTMLLQGYPLFESVQKSVLQINNYFTMGNCYCTDSEFRKGYNKIAESIAEKCCDKRFQSFLETGKAELFETILKGMEKEEERE